MKRAITLVFLVAIEFSSFSQNLVVNPGFEDWENINRPSGWSHVENCIKDSSYAISGDYSCKHSGGLTTTSDLGQTIPVLAGKEYRLTLFNKTIVTDNGKGSRIWCYWLAANSDKLYDPYTDDIIRPSQYFKSENWQQFSINITAPMEAEAFYFEVRTNTKSIAYWDDLTFEEMVPTFNNEKNESSLLIYPNPTSNYLIIQDLNQFQQIDIQNLSGSTMWSGNFSGENRITIPVSGFPNGIYLIKITSSNKCIIRKFIKIAN